MKASVFAELNNLPMVVTGYQNFRIGPYLRGEKSKRNYSNYFKFEKNRIAAWFDAFEVASLAKRMNLVDEPELKTISPVDNVLYKFSANIRWNDFFFGLKDHRELVIKLFWRCLNERIVEQANRIKPPTAGVHIRLGDFRKLGAHERFQKVGGVRTPENYFINVINTLREIHGKFIPVSIFSDGYQHELPELFKLPNVTLVEGNSDIIDLILLSRSKIIVASAGSTFSYWAGFLSNAPLIMHPDHIHQPIRASNGSALYEGPMDSNREGLINEIKNI